MPTNKTAREKFGIATFAVLAQHHPPTRDADIRRTKYHFCVLLRGRIDSRFFGSEPTRVDACRRRVGVLVGGFG